MSQKIFIAHQVLFTFKDEITWDSALALQAEQATLRHPQEIREIKAWLCGRSTVARKQAVDFSLIGFFDTYAELAIYMEHPDHMKGVELWRDISTWTVSDIIVNASELAIFNQLTNG
ncbi:MAG: Dabb family protein [Pseudomonadota bacterium]